MRFAREEPGAAAEPLVSCEACGFRWFGATAAHGLSVLGRCSRCGGELHFRRDAVAGDDAPAPEPQRSELQPWQVLGAPTSWSAR